MIFLLSFCAFLHAMPHRETIRTKLNRVYEIASVVIDETKMPAIVVVKDGAGILKTHYLVQSLYGEALRKQMLSKVCRFLDVLGSAKISVLHARFSNDMCAAIDDAFDATANAVKTVYFESEIFSVHYSPDFNDACTEYFEKRAAEEICISLPLSFSRDD